MPRVPSLNMEKGSAVAKDKQKEHGQAGLSLQTTKERTVDSVSMMTKKREVLENEVTRIETRLEQRLGLVKRLRETHEVLLSKNGHLQERSRLRDVKIAALCAALEEAATMSPTRDQLQSEHPDRGLNVEEAIADKISIAGELLEVLMSCQCNMEGECMASEEAMTRTGDAIAELASTLRQEQERIAMFEEDALATTEHYLQASEQTVKTSAKLDIILEQFKNLKQKKEELQSQFDRTDTCLKDLRIIKHNLSMMTAEDARGMIVRRMHLQSELDFVNEKIQNVQLKPDGSNTDLTDLASDLADQLRVLNEQASVARLAQREVRFIRTQATEILKVAKQAIKSRVEHVDWIKRQRDRQIEELDGMVQEREREQAAFECWKQGALKQMEHATLKYVVLEKEWIRMGALRSQRKSVASEKKALVEERIAQLHALQDRVAELERQSASLADSINKQGRKQTDMQQHIKDHVATQTAASCEAEKTAMMIEDWSAREDDAMMLINRLKRSLEVRLSGIESINRTIQDKVGKIASKYVAGFSVEDLESLPKLLKDETARVHGKLQEDLETAKLSNRKKEQELCARYDDLLKSIQSRYQTEITEKQAQYERLKDRVDDNNTGNGNASDGNAKVMPPHLVAQSPTAPITTSPIRRVLLENEKNREVVLRTSGSMVGRKATKAKPNTLKIKTITPAKKRTIAKATKNTSSSRQSADRLDYARSSSTRRAEGSKTHSHPKIIATNRRQTRPARPIKLQHKASQVADWLSDDTFSFS